MKNRDVERFTFHGQHVTDALHGGLRGTVEAIPRGGAVGAPTF